MPAPHDEHRPDCRAGAAALRFRKWTTLAALFLAVVALINVGLAFLMGRLAGYGPMQILSSWTAEQYGGHGSPGAYVNAVDRLNLGVLQLGGALILGLRAMPARTHRNSAGTAETPPSEKG